MVTSKLPPLTFEREYQARFGGSNGASFTADERQRWETWCRELLQERDELRSELVRLTKTRDAHAQALQTLLPDPSYQFSKEELLAQIDDNPTFGQLVEEVCRMEGK